ncbi:phosphotransferase [Thaumasiovibrio subtropicus]|uniref:phosphotransferase n=1 Tax=Thaumasiovibrio subtropicus TaxID=1891207 RepID=UPI00131C6C6F|nr:phosphotransferase [Thaumasiovibrio subtropicus]
MYKLDSIESCTLICQGVNDSYKVVTASGRYLLRVYRYQWRTLVEIEYEIAAVEYLSLMGVNVSVPLKDRMGNSVQQLSAPEGPRYAVLMSYASGDELAFSRHEDGAMYGRAVAKIHDITDKMTVNHERVLDGDYLIKKPMQVISPLVEYRYPALWEELKNGADKLFQRLKSIEPSQLKHGFCHGDLHGGNAHYDGSQLTFFDFDCCGYGYRAYDLAVFKWRAHLVDKLDMRWESFIQAYTEHRTLTSQELEAVDMFVAIRHLWIIALQIDVAVATGYLHEKFFAHHIGFLSSVMPK